MRLALEEGLGGYGLRLGMALGQGQSGGILDLGLRIGLGWNMFNVIARLGSDTRIELRLCNSLNEDQMALRAMLRKSL